MTASPGERRRQNFIKYWYLTVFTYFIKFQYVDLKTYRKNRQL